MKDVGVDEDLARHKRSANGGASHHKKLFVLSAVTHLAEKGVNKDLADHNRSNDWCVFGSKKKCQAFLTHHHADAGTAHAGLHADTIQAVRLSFTCTCGNAAAALLQT